MKITCRAFFYLKVCLRINDETKPILDRCGVREHVCDILEGGKNAFMDRDHKYGFNKI